MYVDDSVDDDYDDDSANSLSPGASRKRTQRMPVSQLRKKRGASVPVAESTEMGSSKWIWGSLGLSRKASGSFGGR